LRRQATEEWRGVLVAAVLRPEHGEHRELEVVRAAFEQLLDAFELPVRETERLMERLLRQCGQEVSLAAASDVLDGRRSCGVALVVGARYLTVGLVRETHRPPLMARA
jgi:hypothetical protein